jgi:hypothetical protein
VNLLRPFATLVATGMLSALAVTASTPALADPIHYQAILDGLSESPTNNSPATGIADVYFDADADALRVIVDFADLTTPNTAAHIHCCTVIAGAGTAPVATTTPTFTGFPGGTTSGHYDHTFDLSLLSSYRAGFVTDNGGTAATAEAALGAGLASGTAYLNIHTTAFPGGEIRGFLQQVPEPASIALLGIGIVGLATSRRRKLS